MKFKLYIKLLKNDLKILKNPSYIKVNTQFPANHTTPLQITTPSSSKYHTTPLQITTPPSSNYHTTPLQTTTPYHTILFKVPHHSLQSTPPYLYSTLYHNILNHVIIHFRIFHVYFTRGSFTAFCKSYLSCCRLTFTRNKLLKRRKNYIYKYI